MSKPYNTTDLSPDQAFERHIYHRDQFGHYLRWTHILKEAKIGDVIVDFGAGQCNLLEVLYRNRFKPKKYIALEYRKSEVDKAKEKYQNLKFPVEFYQQDVINPTMDYSKFQADKVISFECAEHVGTQNIHKFLKNFKSCGKPTAEFYLSTPNYDGTAAKNHTYDSGDGKGVRPQEFEYFELRDAIEKAGFKIVNTFGTFASQKDYKEYLQGWQIEAFDKLKEYYDSNLVANIMAPIVDAVHARNIMWCLRKQ